MKSLHYMFNINTLHQCISNVLMQSPLFSNNIYIYIYIYIYI